MPCRQTEETLVSINAQRAADSARQEAIKAYGPRAGSVAPYIDELGERVSRGVTWLNDTVPGWRERVDIARLDIEDARHCVLGQVFAEPGSDIDGFDVAYRLAVRSGATQAEGVVTFFVARAFDVRPTHGYGWTESESAFLLTRVWRRVLSDAAVSVIDQHL
jgi:hypothetical protein